MSYDKAKVAEALFDQDVSVIMAELESGPKESAMLSSSLGISESDIKMRLAYLIETGFVIISGTAYSVDSEKLAKFMENDENYKGVVDGLTELDSYLN
jgi:predicted transcriptional regulator